MKNIILVLLLLLSGNSYGNPRIAILNTELDDWTLLPNGEKELKRTASFKPLLENALKGKYSIIGVDDAVQKKANAGKSYLFEHDDISAELGKKLGADWLVVSQHRKISFLYSHFIVHVINTSTQRLMGDYLVELKGNNQTVTEKSIQSMADKVTLTINRR